MVHPRSVYGLLVVHAIPDEAIEAAVDLGQQRRHLCRVCVWLSVTVAAIMCPCASTPICSFFQLTGCKFSQIPPDYVVNGGRWRVRTAQPLIFR